MSDLSCVILAGGRSRRMGRDKALLELPDGQTLLAHTVEVARSLTSDLLIVTPWRDRYESAISPAISPLIQWVIDRQEAGPLAGFNQAWPQIQTSWCLLLACDLPNLKAEELQQWWTWLQQEPQSKTQPTASLTRGKKGWEPLCGYYHRSCIPALNQHLALDNAPAQNPSQRAFQTWLPKTNIAAYSAIPSNMLFNCNTPSDWNEIRSEPSRNDQSI